MGREPPSIPQPGSELERFFDLSLDLLVIAGMDGYMKRVNPAYVRTLGYPVEELLARPMLAVVHPDDVASVGEVLGGLVEGKDVIGFENRVICADGSVRWLQWNTTAVPEQGIVYGVGRDVTDRRRTDAERRVLADEQTALRRVATLVARGVSPAEVFPAVAAEVSVLFGSDISAIVRFEDDGTVTVMGDVGGPNEPGARARPDPGYVIHTVRQTRRSARFDTDDPSTAEMGSLVRSLGVRSAVASPISVEGELWGAITAASRRGPLSPTAERQLTDFTELVATAVANAEAREKIAALAQEQAALRRVATLVADEAPQEEILAAIAAEIGPLIGIEETRLVRFLDDRTAVTVASAGGSDEFPVGELVPADPGSGTPIARVLATGESVSFDPYTPGDGSVAATLLRMGIRSGVCAPIYVDGRLWGSINTGSRQEALARDAESRLAQFTDLLETAIANTESRAEVERLAQEQAALRRVATLVAEHPESEELFSAVAREVAAILSVRGVMVERFETDGSQVVLGSAYDLELAGASAFFGVGVRLPLEPGTLAAAVFETHRAARVEDYSTVEGTVGDAARAAGVGSGCAAPIIVDGRLWGEMCVLSGARQLPVGTEHQLDDFVKLVATAISNYDARVAVRRLADEQAALRRVATLVARGAPQAEIFDGIAQGIQELLGAEKIRMFRYDDDRTALVVAASGDMADYLPVGARQALGGENAASRVFRTGRPARIDDYTATATGPIGEDAIRSGIRGVVATPILVEGGVWGSMVVLTTRDEPLPASTESRLGQFTELMATAIANADSRDQLTASRARLVSAGNEARRRVVRDLHDGAQQRLVHTIITLKFAHRSLRDGGEVAPLVVEALEHAEQANAELRELAHGILPAALTAGGLRAGIDAVVARLAVPVQVEVPAQRFPAEIEANAYFIVAEALTNVVKHSRAEHAGVRAYEKDEQLHVEVRDDGVGGVDPDGSGMIGLSDRAAALGGRLTVDCPAGGGTLVAVTLPLAPG